MQKEKTVTTSRKRKIVPVIFDKGIPEGYYYNRFYCTNCHETETRGVRKGIRAETVSIDCPNCGCKVTG